ncbi:MAG: hypothetical protein E7218_00550 [Anaerofustis stercorihominis]|nr:hypothetical protein [Anaerofustis stercorihominis]
MKYESIYYGCPHCNKSSRTTKIDELIAQEEPTLKKAIIDGEFFDCSCEHCYEVAQVEYSFYYKDVDQGLVIYLYAGKRDGNTEPFEGMYEEGKYYRIVESLDALREKILIFDAGLNDKIVEAVKMLMVYRYNTEHDDKAVQNIYFKRATEDALQFNMSLTDDTFTEAVAPMGLYGEALFTNPYGLNYREEKGEYFVDNQWIRETVILNRMKKDGTINNFKVKEDTGE